MPNSVPSGTSKTIKVAPSACKRFATSGSICEFLLIQRLMHKIEQKYILLGHVFLWQVLQTYNVKRTKSTAILNELVLVPSLSPKLCKFPAFWKCTLHLFFNYTVKMSESATHGINLPSTEKSSYKGMQNAKSRWIKIFRKKCKKGSYNIYLCITIYFLSILIFKIWATNLTEIMLILCFRCKWHKYQ